MAQRVRGICINRAISRISGTARAAAERVLGLALEHLYTNRPHPGGPHPDPREPGAFSSSAVISAAAPLLGLRTSPDFPVRMMRENGSGSGSRSGSDPAADVSRHQQMGDRMRGAEGEDRDGKGDENGDAEIDFGIGFDEETGQQLPYAWIAMFPAEEMATMAPGQRPAPQQQRRPRPPMIVVRSMHADQRLLEFEIACLLGYWHHEHDRLVDPDSPGGTILLPRDPGVITLLHQYAIALLCLPRDCPVTWKCHCNAIRTRFNAPPPDHELPTGQFTLAELEHETERHQRNSEPRFPYRDNNAWTE